MSASNTDGNDSKQPKHTDCLDDPPGSNYGASTGQLAIGAHDTNANDSCSTRVSSIPTPKTATNQSTLQQKTNFYLPVAKRKLCKMQGCAKTIKSQGVCQR